MPQRIHFKKKAMVRSKERYYIIVKGKIQQDDITLVNDYSLNRGTPKYVKQN